MTRFGDTVVYPSTQFPNGKVAKHFVAKVVPFQKDSKFSQKMSRPAVVEFAQNPKNCAFDLKNSWQFKSYNWNGYNQRMHHNFDGNSSKWLKQKVNKTNNLCSFEEKK